MNIRLFQGLFSLITAVLLLLGGVHNAKDLDAAPKASTTLEETSSPSDMTEAPTESEESLPPKEETTEGEETVTTTEPTPSTTPQTTKPQTTKPQTTKPQTTKPQTTQPQTTKPQTTLPETTSPVTTVPPTTDVPTYSEEDLYWLSRIISAESKGEPMEGMIAVGNVILNRVRHPDFANTVKGVIFEEGQFTPVKNGTVYDAPTAGAIEAAKRCLNGETVTSSALFFFNPAVSTSSWIKDNRPYLMTIGNHAFYG